MNTLLSGYDRNTEELIFRVYTVPVPEADRKLRARLSHLTACDLLSAALFRDFGVHHAVIRREGLGKPQLVHESLHMNLSHCKGLAVAAVGMVPLGVDAEPPRPVRAHLLPRLCTPEECGEISRADNPEFVFSRFWTLKEAYAKYTGEGIGLDFSSLGFTLGIPPVFHHPAANRVQFYQILLKNQHAVSLCVPRGDFRIAAAESGDENGKEDNHAVD